MPPGSETDDRPHPELGDLHSVTYAANPNLSRPESAGRTDRAASPSEATAPGSRIRSTGRSPVSILAPTRSCKRLRWRRPSAVAVSGSSLRVANAYGLDLAQVNETTGALTRRIAIPVRPADVAFADGAMWISSESAGTVLRGDPGHRRHRADQRRNRPGKQRRRGRLTIYPITLPPLRSATIP